MLRLANMSNLDEDLERIDFSSSELQRFLQKHKLDGLEILLYGKWQEKIISKEFIYGVHLTYFPHWIDFYLGKQEKLLRYLGSEENIIACFGGSKPESLIENYQEQVKTATMMQSDYMVFHIDDVDIGSIIGKQTDYTNEDIIDYSVELINHFLKDDGKAPRLLVENLWTKGMNLLEPRLVEKVLNNINYSNLGIMLDTGHLMNTDPSLRNEEEAVEYIIDVVNKLGDNKKYITGLHLQRSLSGEYRERMKGHKLKTPKEEMEYILCCDEHKPFTSDAVQRLLEFIEPKHITYEFVTSSKEQWEDYIETQNKALGLEV